MGARMMTTVRKVMARQLVEMNLSRLSQRGSSRPVKTQPSCHSPTSRQTAPLKMLDSSVYMVNMMVPPSAQLMGRAMVSKYTMRKFRAAEASFRPTMRMFFSILRSPTCNYLLQYQRNERFFRSFLFYTR